MRYIDPKDVKSPKAHWTLIDVLHDGGAEEYSVAIGEWDGNRCLAMRWNGNGERPLGNPQSRGLPTWFVLPNDNVLQEFRDELVKTLRQDKQVFVGTALKF